jgi:hypothetical protein
VVQALPSNRADESLGVWILPGTSRCCENLLDAQRLDSQSNFSTVPVIAIADEILGGLSVCERLYDLLRRPSPGRMLPDIEMQDLATMSEAWQLLCGRCPFHNVSPRQVAKLLRALAKAGVLMQAEDGMLLLAPAGEKIVNHYSFYTVFQTTKEYRIITDSGKTLGTLPVSYPVHERSLMIFGGQRWRVLQVDRRQKVIQVAKASGGNVPRFSGTSGAIHDRVREEMRTIYEETEIPRYLDAQASEFLLQGRQQYYISGCMGSTWSSETAAHFYFCGPGTE